MTNKGTPADTISVDHDELIDIATISLKEETGQDVKEIVPESAMGRLMYGAIDTYNANLKSRGYDGNEVKVGAILLTPGGSASFRVGDKGVIAISQQFMDKGPDSLMRQIGHEFGHLYHQHGTNLLSDYHPDIYKDNNPNIVRLQDDHSALFSRVGVDYEKQHNAEKIIDPKLAEYQAETMAVRQSCLPEVSSADLKGALDRLQTVNLSPEKKIEKLNMLGGVLDATESPLPAACGQKLGL